MFHLANKTDMEVAEPALSAEFSMQELLPYKLYHISAIHERIAFANMTRITGVTLSEWRVMGNVACGFVTFTRLAEELLLDKGQLSNIIKQLQKKQLIEKRKSTLDGRQINLSLTPLGEEKKRFIIDMAHKYLETIEQGLDKSERKALHSALTIVEQNARAFWSKNGDSI